MGRNEMKIEGDRVTLCQMTEKDLDLRANWSVIQIFRFSIHFPVYNGVNI